MSKRIMELGKMMYLVEHTLHQWWPLIPTLTVKVHKRYPWGNHAEGGTGPLYLYIVL